HRAHVQRPTLVDHQLAGREDPDLGPREIVPVVPVAEDQREVLVGSGQPLAPRPRAARDRVSEAAVGIEAHGLVTATLDRRPGPARSDPRADAGQARPAERQRVLERIPAATATGEVGRARSDRVPGPPKLAHAGLLGLDQQDASYRDRIAAATARRIPGQREVVGRVLLVAANEGRDAGVAVMLVDPHAVDLDALAG